MKKIISVHNSICYKLSQNLFWNLINIPSIKTFNLCPDIQMLYQKINCIFNLIQYRTVKFLSVKGTSASCGRSGPRTPSCPASGRRCGTR